MSFNESRHPRDRLSHKSRQKGTFFRLLMGNDDAFSLHHKLGVPTATSFHRRHILVNKTGASFHAGNKYLS
jgi:hypothetical protein